MRLERFRNLPPSLFYLLVEIAHPPPSITITPFAPLTVHVIIVSLCASWTLPHCRFLLDIQTSVHGNSSLHLHFIILSSHKVVYRVPYDLYANLFLDWLLLSQSYFLFLDRVILAYGPVAWTYLSATLVLDAACAKVAIPGVS